MPAHFFYIISTELSYILRLRLFTAASLANKVNGRCDWSQSTKDCK